MEMAKNIFFEEICDGVLCKAAESFEDEVEEEVYLNLLKWSFGKFKERLKGKEKFGTPPDSWTPPRKGTAGWWTGVHLPIFNFKF